MKHASAAALEGLSQLLVDIRRRAGLTEKKTGIFYRKSKAFLHFHEDPAGMFADLSSESGFDRYPVNNRKEKDALLAAIDIALKG
jgi:hypothetical protein